jgi:lysophospholipase L1-like esterase
MRLPKFVLLIVIAVAFLSGMTAHSAIVNHGISWRRVLGFLIPEERVRAEILNRQTSAQYITTRDFFAEFPGNSDIVMFGDSQIAFADWPLLLGISVANRGIYGETTEAALLRVNSIVAAHSKCVVTMLGIGDLSIGRSVESTAQDYSAVLNRLATSGTTIIVQSTLPTESPYSLNPKVAELNSKIEMTCSSNRNCQFLNLGHIITPGSTIDGIHLRPNTYKAWANELKPILTARCSTPQ